MESFGNKMLRFLGSIVVAIITISFPILFGLSIGFNWEVHVTIVCGLATLLELVLLIRLIYYEADNF